MKDKSHFPEEVLNAFKLWAQAINSNRSETNINLWLSRFNKVCEANGLNAADTLRILNTDNFDYYKSN